MTAKYLSAALPLLLSVAGLGCAQSTAQAPVSVASTTHETPHKTATAKPRALRSANVAQSMQPLTNTTHADSAVVNRTKEGGVGLIGPERSYIDQVDSSGWSGISAPPLPSGIGGGPASGPAGANEEKPAGDEKPATDE